MRPYRITHTTHYRYNRPVELGPQRLMLRPRDSHTIRLSSTALSVNPQPAETRWLLDVYGNSVAVLSFAGQAEELRIESRIELEHYGLDDPDLVTAPFAQSWPFNYLPDELPDLAPYRMRQWSDPAGVLDRWVRQLFHGADEVGTEQLLRTLSSTIKETLPYRARFEEGTQGPLQTLAEGGTCRDFAALMMEALRSLGIAARFVSGYLYSPALDPEGGSGNATTGAGATHAWVDVYLPGAGWVEFDPTNNLFGSSDLIRVCVARSPEQASPVSGSYVGAADAALPMEVSVVVERL
ncbi:MAG: transglutaminase family protein [Geminicoccaceae bacterium]